MANHFSLFVVTSYNNYEPFISNHTQPFANYCFKFEPTYACSIRNSISSFGYQFSHLKFQSHFHSMENFDFFPLNHHPLLQLSYALLITSNIPFAVSEIMNAHIINDYQKFIWIHTFGFLKDGHTSISLKDISWKSKNHTAQLNPSSIGFLVSDSSSQSTIFNESMFNKDFCILSGNYGKVLFTFEKLTTNSSTYNFATSINEPGDYVLMFGNCQSEFALSMDIHVEMYNLKHGEKDFLSAGETNLPMLYFLFFLIYTSFFIIWVFTCIKQRSIIIKIHIIMGALLLFKALAIICDFKDYVDVKKTGTSHGWDVAFDNFQFFKDILLFTVIVLIGNGWFLLKPYIQERDKKVLMIVLPLQVLENMAYAVLVEIGPITKDWFTWILFIYLIDILCCCAVFFTTSSSTKSLREASKKDGNAAKNLEKLILFKQFYMAVVGYLYFTRIGVLAIELMMNYRYAWVRDAANEAASLAFYLFIFYNFKAIEGNPYFKIVEDEVEAIDKLLEEDLNSRL